MKKCVILGAGASAGYDDKLDNDNRPPVTDSLIPQALKSGIIHEETYSYFFTLVRHYSETQLGQKYVASQELDLECFLEWTYNQWNSLKSVWKDESKTTDGLDSNDYAGALGESWYMMWEIIKHYSRVQNDANNYHEIIKTFSESPFAIITTNYDTLFESVLLKNGGTYSYFVEKDVPEPSQGIPVIKLHGSINWINPIHRAITLGGSDPKGVMHKIAPIIHSNAAWMSTKLVNPVKITYSELKLFFPSETEYFEPIIIPPTGRHKNYFKNSPYSNLWEKAKIFLSSAEEVIIIGSSLRPQDQQFLSLLKYFIRSDAKLTVVNRTQEDVEDVSKRLSDLLELPSIDSIKGFSPFSKYIEQLELRLR